MAIMTTTTPPFSISVEVVAAKTTAWVALPTTKLPHNEACYGQIYQLNAQSLVAFDVIYNRDIVPTASRCLPVQVASWWLQDQGTTSTSTKLGPDFECPGMYSEVQAFTERSSTRYIMCCPTGYNLAQIASPKGFAPTQCTSSIIQGQIVSYAVNTNGGWLITSTTNTGRPSFVYAQHVNGYSVSSTTSSSMTTTASSAITSSFATDTSSVNSSKSTTTEAPSTGLSTPAKVGIGIGAALAGLIAILALAFVLVRRRRGKDIAEIHEKGEDSTRGELGNQDARIGSSHFSPVRKPAPSNGRVFELQ